MTEKSRGGGLAAEIRSSKDRVVDFLGAVVPLRARETPAASPEADLSNVVPITSRRRIGPDKRIPEVPLAKDDRPAPPTKRLERRRLLALLVIGSLAVHASLFAAFNRPPPPLASVGEVVIDNIELVGTDRLAGLNRSPSESEIDSAAAPKKDEPLADKSEAPQKADEKSKPEEPAKTDKPITAALSPDPVAELPLPPKEPAEPAIAPSSDDKAEKPAERKIEPAPKRKKESEEGKSNRSRATPASTPSISSNSIGRGRSDADTNYRGLVSAHLARYKQFPADARARGDQGSATVTFSLDSGGRVTAARLERGSGVASLDRETLAMVRRASPFPAPPDGRAQSFTQQINWYLR